MLEKLMESIAKMGRTLERIEERLNVQVAPAVVDDNLLTAEQVAAMLDLSMSAIYANVSQRRIPAYKKGKRLYFDRAEIRAWQKSNKKESADDLAGNVDAFYKRKMTKRR